MAVYPLVNGRDSVNEIILESALIEFETCKAIAELLDRGLIREATQEEIARELRRGVEMPRDTALGSGVASVACGSVPGSSRFRSDYRESRIRRTPGFSLLKISGIDTCSRASPGSVSSGWRSRPRQLSTSTASTPRAPTNCDGLSGGRAARPLGTTVSPGDAGRKTPRYRLRWQWSADPVPDPEPPSRLGRDRDRADRPEGPGVQLVP